MGRIRYEIILDKKISVRSFKVELIKTRWLVSNMFVIGDLAYLKI